MTLCMGLEYGTWLPVWSPGTETDTSTVNSLTSRSLTRGQFLSGQFFSDWYPWLYIYSLTSVPPKAPARQVEWAGGQQQGFMHEQSWFCLQGPLGGHHLEWLAWTAMVQLLTPPENKPSPGGTTVQTMVENCWGWEDILQFVLHGCTPSSKATFFELTNITVNKFRLKTWRIILVGQDFFCRYLKRKYIEYMLIFDRPIC
jgi:hypothetical protein